MEHPAGTSPTRRLPRVPGMVNATTPPPSPPLAATQSTNLSPVLAGSRGDRSPERFIRSTSSTPSSTPRIRSEECLRGSILPPLVLDVHCTGSPSLPRRHRDVGSPDVAGRSPPPSPGPLPALARQAPRGKVPAGMDGGNVDASPPPRMVINRGVQAPESVGRGELQDDGNGGLVRPAVSNTAGRELANTDGSSDVSPIRLVHFVGAGEMARLATLAYVTLSDDAPVDAPHAIRTALLEYVEHVHYQLLMSSGHMLLQFDTPADREAVVEMSPIPLSPAGRLTLERPEATCNRCPLLLALEATNFAAGQVLYGHPVLPARAPAQHDGQVLYGHPVLRGGAVPFAAGNRERNGHGNFFRRLLLGAVRPIYRALAPAPGRRWLGDDRNDPDPCPAPPSSPRVDETSAAVTTPQATEAAMRLANGDYSLRAPVVSRSPASPEERDTAPSSGVPQEVSSARGRLGRVVCCAVDVAPDPDA